MQINYCCTYWGAESLSMDTFFSKLKQAGYNGVELFLEPVRHLSAPFMTELMKARHENEQFSFIAQLICPGRKLSVAEYIQLVSRQLEELADLQPDCINSQTGRDYFSFEDNCRILDVLSNFSEKKGIPMLHETHRGSFSFHAPTLIPYLERYPALRLTADFSHFCAVSESLLQDQEEMLSAIIPHVQHIHARVGHEQGPQVNDPFAPEWQQHVTVHLGWWKQILQQALLKKMNSFTITPEFGPWPYMPSLPYTRQPLSNQWTINTGMMEYLRQHLKTSTEND